MMLAGMQPYFFPYLGYFALIKLSDLFIIADSFQYIERGWIDRNRILKPGDGWQYIRVPLVKHSHKIMIKDVEIRVDEPWRDRIYRQLEHYKRIAPYYKQVISFLHVALSLNTDNISILNTHLLDETCRYIDIPFNSKWFSELDLDIADAMKADEWALNTCKALGYSTYINPPGGESFYDKSKYDKSHIDLRFLKVNLKNYHQGRSIFEEALSIIDVMMFNTPSEIRAMLDDYQLL
ncbi:MAG: WbqC family protein [Syntrophaceae bacterium]|nr:WbqC family protein [Syntrophaceae bacterium]